MTSRAPVVRRVVWFISAVGALCFCGCAPGGTPWTIQCLELQGPHRAQHIEQIAETLKRTPGIRAEDVWYSDDPDGFARLYHGKYFRRTDPLTRKGEIPPQARRDLELLRQLGTGTDRHHFLLAMLVRMPMPDVGNPDWALNRAGGAYSLQVAAFEPTSDFWEFKQAAAEYCALLRKKGHEAYYHHGPACSIVTVGTFGCDAVIYQRVGWARYSAGVMALQRNKLFMHNLVNGKIIKRKTEKGGSVPMPSQLVPIPGGEPCKR